MAKKIIFMGTPLFAVPILKSLYQNGYPISVVYTQPPQKSHRGQKINKSPIQGISETLKIDFRCPENLKDNDEEYKFIKNLNADLAIIVFLRAKSDSLKLLSFPSSLNNSLNERITYRPRLCKM